MNRKLDTEELKRGFLNERPNSNALNTFFEHFTPSRSLFKMSMPPDEVENREAIIQVIKQNFIVNLVTALEVFLKNTINEVKWSNEIGYLNLLKDSKINLNDAFHLFSTVKITREYIISSYFSFQNLETIQKVFGELTGKDFLESVEAIVPSDFPAGQSEQSVRFWNLVKEIMTSFRTNGRKNLGMLFEIRNRIIHEGGSEIISKEQVDEFENSVVMFTWMVTNYCKIHEKSQGT